MNDINKLIAIVIVCSIAIYGLSVYRAEAANSRIEMLEAQIKIISSLLNNK